MVSATSLKIAIVGAGPGGLAAALNLLKLDFVDLSVFDQAKELREVGAGITINENTWRQLQLLGVAEKIEQYTDRGDGSKIDVEYRNGRTGKVLVRTYQSADLSKPARSRIERYKLQNALLSKIPAGLIQLEKKLEEIDESSNGVTLTFTDGTVQGPFDLIIGADGIRSVVRHYAFPEHRLTFTGKVAYRTLIPQSAVAHVKDIPQGAAFWQTKNTHVYTQPLDNGLFEIATRALVSDEEGLKVSWGQKVSKDQVVHHYDDYCETIRQVVAAPDEWLEFALFGGPRLESVIHNGRIALLGDASHPLSGAFGSGAAFAFEDAYVLSQALAHVRANGSPVSEALRLYDHIRSPHYKALYEVLNSYENAAKEIANAFPGLDDDEFVDQSISKGRERNIQWIYQYDVTAVWKEQITHSLGSTDSKALGNNVHVSPAIAVA